MGGGTEIVALVRDLMFASRVRGSAPGAKLARDTDRLLSLVGPATRLVIVEVEAGGSVEAIEAVRERVPSARVIAFGPHVMEAELSAAGLAGAEVLTRGVFVKRLPELVSQAGSS